MKALVAGWFSFDQMGATAGDLMARDIACDWLARAHYEYEVACAPPFEGGIDWRSVDPSRYSHVLFVCGPFGNGWPLTDFLPRFQNCRLVGLNLSMLQDLDEWNPFELLFERDSSAACHPDISLLAPLRRVPVAGIIQCDPVSEYGDRNKDEIAHAAVQRLVGRREVARVHIDTRLDRNQTGLRTSGEVENLIARTDVVVTTRLHGMVLAIKNGVPAVVIDCIIGRGKISRQAEVLGWPAALDLTTLSDEALDAAFDYCLTPEARRKALECRARAITQLGFLRDNFIRELRGRRNEATGRESAHADAVRADPKWSA